MQIQEVLRKLFIPTLVVIWFLGHLAHAEIKLDTDKGNTTFRVAGKQVDPNAAVLAAVAGESVERCKPKALNGKKTYYTSGGTATEVIECARVEILVNPKTGDPKWSVVK